MILGVIPARGGSKGLPNKHTKLLLGKPVIAYTIEAAQKAKKFDRLVVSTEDDNIAAVSRNYDIEVISRPTEFASDEAGIDDALKHAVETIEKEGNKINVIVWMQANVPIREDGVIDAVIKKLNTSDADSVITVSLFGWPVEKAVKIVDGVIKPYWVNPVILPRRQDYPVAYFANGAVIAMLRDNLMCKTNSCEPYDYFLGEKRFAFVLEKFEHGVEIDDHDDFLVVETFLEKLNKL